MLHSEKIPLSRMESVNALSDAMSTTITINWEATVFFVCTSAMGIYYLILKRRFDREEKQDTKDETEKAKEETEIKTMLSQLGLRIEAESEERRRDIDKECRERREKDDALGRDIWDTREELSHLCGELGKDRPRYRQS